jgi:hypothetical protein
VNIVVVGIVVGVVGAVVVSGYLFCERLFAGQLSAHIILTKVSHITGTEICFSSVG